MSLSVGFGRVRPILDPCTGFGAPSNHHHPCPVPPHPFTNVLLCIQVYKGEETTFHLFGLQWNTDYRLRVVVCRRCSDTQQELSGSFSPPTHFSPRRSSAPVTLEAGSTNPSSSSSRKNLSDEQFASLIVLAVASLSVFVAYLLQLLI